MPAFLVWIIFHVHQILHYCSAGIGIENTNKFDCGSPVSTAVPSGMCPRVIGPCEWVFVQYRLVRVKKGETNKSGTLNISTWFSNAMTSSGGVRMTLSFILYYSSALLFAVPP